MVDTKALRARAETLLASYPPGAYFPPGSIEAATFYDAVNPAAIIQVLDRIDALESGHVVAVEAQLADVAEVLGKERLEASDGYHGTAVRVLVAQLAAALAAKDEACDLAKSLAWKLHRECPNDTDESEHPTTLKRISTLRGVGK